MTTKENKFFVPVRLIVLDVLGTVLLMTGLVRLFAGVHFLPEQLRLKDYGFALIFTGIVLMLPLMVHLVARIVKRTKFDI